TRPGVAHQAARWESASRNSPAAWSSDCAAFSVRPFSMLSSPLRALSLARDADEYADNAAMPNVIAPINANPANAKMPHLIERRTREGELMYALKSTGDTAIATAMADPSG